MIPKIIYTFNAISMGFGGCMSKIFKLFMED